VSHHQWKGLLSIVPDDMTIGTNQLLLEDGEFSADGECVADDARYDENENGEEFEERSCNRSASGLGFIWRTERSLNDILVRAPIP
jgi:hypothetical protein